MYFYPISDLAIIPLSNGKVLFKSDSIAIRIDGKSTVFFVEKIFPLLDGQNDLKKISSIVDVSEKELEYYLNNLVKHGILRQSTNPKKKNELLIVSPLFENFLESLGMPQDEIHDYLEGKRIGIIGLDSIGYNLILMLIQYGVNKIKLADNLELDDGDRHILNFISKNSIGQKRQDVIKKQLLKEYPHLDIDLIEYISLECIENFAEGCDILIGCFDKAYVASNYWINEVALKVKIPSLYAEIKGQKCFIGPLVIPDKTACYMCYKMRSISCSKDFEEAMSYEENLNKQKTSKFTNRSFFPSNVYLTASLVASEVIKLLLSLDLPSITGKVMEFDVFNLEYKIHNILQKSDCPVCRKKKPWIRKHFDLDELLELNQFEGDLVQYKNILISNLTGIINYMNVFPKDINEPHIPIIYRTDLSNHRYIPNQEADDAMCSGKGLTFRQAKTSALGEAVERYSGAVYQKEEIFLSSYMEINKKKLHPKHLVLFENYQYQKLEYSKFDEKSIMGWVKAYSLLHKEEILVPAISVFMDYKIISQDEYIFPITSNGLATGATLLQAIISASLEIIERDAFVITWHQKLTCRRYDPLTVPLKDVVSYCKMYNRRGVELSLYKLPTDFPCHVFLAIAQQLKGEGPSIVVGLGADFNPINAAKGAIIEVGQVRPALRKRLRFEETQKRLNELINDSSKVKDLEDHDLLYASPQCLNHFDFLLNLPINHFDLEEKTLSEEEKINRLLNHVKLIDSDVIYYNLTPPEMEKLHLFTVRAILPGLQPIHFGYDKIRLSGTRLYELPYRLGLKKEINSYNEINFQPHPLT